LNSIGTGAILIHQHTVGGNWNDGIAIYDSLLMSKCETVVLCYAQASSMSSITIQAATARVLMPNTEFMVHYGFYGTEGIPSQVRSSVERYKKIDIEMLKMYARRCINGEFFQKKKMTEKEVIKFIENKIQKHTDWFMDANEAVYYGFADLIMGQDGLDSIDKLRVPSKKKHHDKRN